MYFFFFLVVILLMFVFMLVFFLFLLILYQNGYGLRRSCFLIFGGVALFLFCRWWFLCVVLVVWFFGVCGGAVQIREFKLVHGLVGRLIRLEVFFFGCFF